MISLILMTSLPKRAGRGMSPKARVGQDNGFCTVSLCTWNQILYLSSLSWQATAKGERTIRGCLVAYFFFCFPFLVSRPLSC
jgi:hypothetical protein